MSGASIGIGSVIIGITAALMVMGGVATVIVATAGPADAALVFKTGSDYCRARQDSCKKNCERTQIDLPSNLGACVAGCELRFIDCISRVEKRKGSGRTVTGTTTAPVTPTKAGQNIGKASGVKKDPMNVQPIIQSDSGNSTTPKTKNVGKIGGVNNVWGSRGSQSTSDGTILMKRSGSGKKH